MPSLTWENDPVWSCATWCTWWVPNTFILSLLIIENTTIPTHKVWFYNQVCSQWLHTCIIFLVSGYIAHAGLELVIIWVQYPKASVRLTNIHQAHPKNFETHTLTDTLITGLNYSPIKLLVLERLQFKTWSSKFSFHIFTDPQLDYFSHLTLVGGWSGALCVQMLISVSGDLVTV